MKSQGLTGILSAATSILIAQPVWAVPTEVTAIKLNRTGRGIELVFNTQGDSRPPIFTVSRGKSSVADIVNTQLRLPGGKPFQQNNPAPGITSVVVSQLDENTTRVVVSGAKKVPMGQVIRRKGTGLVLSFDGNTVAQAATPAQTPNPAPQPSATPPVLPRAIAPPVGDIVVSPVETTAASDDIDLGTSERIPRLLLREAPVREVLALLARAAGLNLAFSVDSSGAGTQAGQPQPAQPPPAQAPQAPTTTPQAQPSASAASEGPKISLDIEDEPVQDLFNYVLRISGLEANRIGRTIFVGSRLPDNVRSLVTRTIRLNQVPIVSAANYLAAQGAETQLPINQVEIQTIGEGASARTIETRTPNILKLQATAVSGPLLLKGLSVVVDERLNSVTLAGSASKVRTASNLLTQLDLRRRQVAVNVKVIDINLLNTKDLNSSFSFGSGRSFFAIDNGAAVFNYGGFNPPSAAQASGGLSPRITPNPYGGAPFLDAQPNAPFGTGTPQPFGNPPLNDGTTQPIFGTYPRPPFGTGVNPFQPGVTSIPADGPILFGLPTLFQYPLRLLSALRAQITSGDAKILTDPTLMVQEGQKSTVQLGQEVFAGFRTTVAAGDGGVSTATREPIIKNAGITLDVQIERIDDNGFIALSIEPIVSAPTGVAPTDDGPITLLSNRRLNSGQIRLRDGQTLILTGIIQDSDQSTVSKVPILGDIPILGRLFRSTNRTRARQEVIVLLTPQIMNDSDQSTAGYRLSPEAEKTLKLKR